MGGDTFCRMCGGCDATKQHYNNKNNSFVISCYDPCDWLMYFSKNNFGEELRLRCHKICVCKLTYDNHNIIVRRRNLMIMIDLRQICDDFTTIIWYIVRFFVNRAQIPKVTPGRSVVPCWLFTVWVVCGRETNWKQTAASSETKYSLTTSILFQARASFSWFNLCSLLTTQPANSRPTAQQYQQHSIQQTVEFTDFKTVRKFMNFYRIVNKFKKNYNYSIVALL